MDESPRRMSHLGMAAVQYEAFVRKNAGPLACRAFQHWKDFVHRPICRGTEKAEPVMLLHREAEQLWFPQLGTSPRGCD